jgi:predicted nuclease of predicted toxin-antitoxin system
MPRLLFYLDEDVKKAVAQGLQARGVDVLRTQDAGRSGENDLDQISFARNAGRVILTHDSDYLNHHSRGVSHAGILYCPQGKYSIGQLIQLLYLYHMAMTTEEMQGTLEFL